MKINNMPNWAKSHKYLVVRIVDEEAWFYDAWDDWSEAYKQSLEVGGCVIPIGAAE